MENKEELTGRLYKLLKLFAWEMESAWDYGTGTPIPHSEAHLLDAIKDHDGAKASDLAAIMGISCGAVSQITRKLLGKTLVEDYKIPGNRKEVYFRLTALGEKAYLGHRKHHDKIDAGFFEYVEHLKEKDVQTIYQFLDVLIQTMEKLKDS
jgi:DNA-binding MarR family transcriptional regulator